MRIILPSLPLVVSLFIFFLGTTAHASSYGEKLCVREAAQFNCYKVKKGDTWDNLFTSKNREIVMRINRMNIDLTRGTIIAIPIKLDNTALLDWTPLPVKIAPPGEKVIMVSISNLAFGAYDPEGTLKYWGPVSTARGYCPDIHRKCTTPIGSFKIFTKAGPGCVSTKFPVGRGGAPMPYCMYFHGGFALHGSYELPGYNASHGCVRLFVDDAKWLNQNFTTNEHDTLVIIQK